MLLLNVHRLNQRKSDFSASNVCRDTSAAFGCVNTCKHEALPVAGASVSPNALMFHHRLVSQQAARSFLRGVSERTRRDSFNI